MTDRSATCRQMSRRTVLGSAAVTGAALVAGCLDGEDVPDPIEIESGKQCDNCTMEVVNMPGPAGQTFYDEPENVFDEDRPGQFCSSTCTYTHTFEQEADGHEPIGMYLTDYSNVDYEIETDDDELVITSHLGVEAYELVDELTLVVDSDVEGAMGASMIGFSDADDAESFQDEYGGDSYAHEDVTQELVMSLM